MEQKYEQIDLSKISEDAKNLLNELKSKTKDFMKVQPNDRKAFNNLYDKIKNEKPECLKAGGPIKKEKSKKSEKSENKNFLTFVKKIRKNGEAWKDAIKRAKSEIVKTKGLTGQSDLVIDSERKALKPGWRRTSPGTVYYENRANRSDRQRNKFPFLEKGGELNDKELGAIYDPEVTKFNEEEKKK